MMAAISPALSPVSSGISVVVGAIVVVGFLIMLGYMAQSLSLSMFSNVTVRQICKKGVKHFKSECIYFQQGVSI